MKATTLSMVKISATERKQKWGEMIQKTIFRTVL